LLAMTGALHAALLPLAAAATLSVCDTAMASAPLKTSHELLLSSSGW
jgi:hypothetical protein